MNIPESGTSCSFRFKTRASSNDAAREGCKAACEMA